MMIAFVLTNPGLLKLPLEQIYHGGEIKSPKPANAEYVSNDWLW